MNNMCYKCLFFTPCELWVCDKYEIYIIPHKMVIWNKRLVAGTGYESVMLHTTTRMRDMYCLLKETKHGFDNTFYVHLLLYIMYNFKTKYLFNYKKWTF